jgi:hypothetical protein
MTNLLQKRNRKPPHKLHIWFFADTQANAKNQKSNFISNAQGLKVSLDFTNKYRELEETNE